MFSQSKKEKNSVLAEGRQNKKLRLSLTALLVSVFLYGSAYAAIPSANGLVTPHQVDSGQLCSITYKTTNITNVTIKKVEITLPAGFTYVSLGAVTASGGKIWTAVYAGEIVTLTPQDSAQYLANSEYVQVVINITTKSTAQSATVWSCLLTDASGTGTAVAQPAIAGDMSVTILLLSATGLLSPSIVDGGQTSAALTYRTTNTGTDTIKLIRIAIPAGFTFVGSGAISASSGKIWTASSSGTIVTLAPAATGDYISNAQFVQAVLNVSTQSASQAAATWTDEITGNYNGTKAATEAVAGNMQAEIKSLSARALVTPRQVYDSLAGVGITYRTTNTGSDKIKLLKITIPSGFTYVSTASITAGGKTWTAAYASNVLTLTPQAIGDYIGNTEYVQAVINVTTQTSAQGAVEWPAAVTGEYNGTADSTEAVEGDMQVEIVSLFSNGLAVPHQVYNSKIDLPVAYRLTNTGTDTIKLIVITIPAGFTYKSTGALTTSPGGKIWTASASGSLVTLTPSSTSDYISIGQYVQVEINVDTQATAKAPAAWPAAVTGVNNKTNSSTEAAGNDMKVEIMTLTARGVVLPHIVSAAEASVPVTCRITNTGTDTLKKIELTLPAGFTHVSNGSITVSDGKAWTAAYLAPVVTLTANSSSDYLSDTQYIEAVINVATQAAAQASTAWPAVITGALDGTASATGFSLSDMEVEIRPLLSYSAVTPHIVDGGQSGFALSYKTTNGGSEDIKLIRIAVPSGFTYASSGTVTVAGKTWTASEFGGVVTLTPAGAGDYLTKYENIEAIINVNTSPGAAAAVTWPCQITGVTNNISSSIEAAAGDMQVEIKSLSASGLVLPRIVDGGQAGIALSCRTTNTGSDTIKLIKTTIPSGFTYVSSGAVTASSGKTWTASQAGGVLTLTPQAGSDYISSAEYVEVVLNVATQTAAQGLTAWPTTVTGNYNGTSLGSEAVADAMKVEIKSLFATGIVVPHIVDGGQPSQSVTYSTTNAGTDTIKLIKISIPSGFTFVTAGLVTASGGKTWTASAGGTVVTLTPAGESDYITGGEHVDVIINVATQVNPLAATTWPASATGNYNGTAPVTEAALNDMKVEIKSLSANALITPRTVDGGQTSFALTYKTTATGSDKIRLIRITVPAGFSYLSSSSISASAGKSWSASYTAPIITLTPGGAGDYIDNSEYVQVVINAATQSASRALTIWPAEITGSSNGIGSATEALVNDMKVEIKSLSAVSLVTPHQVYVSSAVSLTHRITNLGADSAKLVRITIPAGFTYTGLGTVTATGGKTWTAAYAGGVVTLTPAAAGDYINSAEYVQAVINVTTQAAYQAPVAWPAVITGNYNGTAQTTEAVLNDKNVEIVTLLARGIVTPHQLDGGQASQAVTYRVTNADVDKIKKVQIIIPAGFTYTGLGTVTATGGKTWTAAYAGGVVTLTPAAAGDYINSTEYVQAVINVTTQAAYQAPTVWPATATGENNGAVSVSEGTAGDMQVEIKDLVAVSLVTPHQVYVSSAVSLTHRITNMGADSAKLVRITIPAGFTYTGLGTVTATGGKTWTAAYAGGVVTLTPAAAGDYINSAEYVQAVINVTTQAAYQAPVAWPAVITGNYNGTAQTTEAVLNDKNVEIVTLLARGIVTPHQLDGGQSSQAVTYRVTNAGADKLKSVRLTIPAGFTYVSSGTVTVTGGKTWTAAYAGGVVTLTPAGAGDYLISAEYVQAVINVATQTAYQAPTVWPAVATGENNGTVSVTVITAGDMSVEIIPLSATAVATPHIVPGGRASVAVTYRVTNSNTDALKLVQITIPAGFTYASLGAVSASLSKSWTASRSGAVITLTPTAAGDYIANTQYVQVVINVATQASAMAPATWPAVVTGSYNGTAAASEVTAGDRQVEIQILFANGLLTPHQVYNSSSVALTCRVTNAGTDDIRLAKITIPTGFTFNSLGTVSASLSKSWTSGIGGTVITLTPAASGDYLSSGQYVQVIINVTTQAAAQAAVIWPIGVTGNLSGAGAATEAVTNDMRVQIVTLNANGLATPHAVNTSQNTAITHRTTNTGTDRLKKVVITVPAGFSSITPGVLTATGGKIWTASAGGSLITLNAATANDYITNAQYVEVVIGVLTQATALSAVAWPALVTGENNNTFSSTEAVAGNMKVAIVNLAANGLVTPHVVYNSRPSVGLTYRVTGSQAEKIKSASLTIPGGFTYVSLGTPAASGGKNWTASYAGGVVTLNASLAGDYLDNTEYVQVLINVATQAGTLAATIWPGRVTGASDTYRDLVEPVAGAMQVEIKTLAATAVVTPHVVSSSRTGVALTYIITGTGTDNIQLALITIPAGFTYESIVSVTASGIKSWSGVCAGSVITLQANSAGDNIATGEYVQLIVNTATQGANQAPVTWPVALTGAAGGTVPGTEAAAGDMQIQIATLAANGLITPHQVLGSLASVAITCRVSNINTYKIKEAKITIPAGFTYVSNGLVSASGAKVWTGSYSGGELTLSAALPVNYLDNAEYIEVIINVSTQSADLAPAEWPVLVTGESNNTVAATEAAAGNMKVEIFAISAAGLITPHLVAGQSLVPFTYRITNTSLGLGVIKRIRITIPSGFTYVSTGAITAGGKNWTAAYASNVITLNPQTSADYINKTEFVQVVISVTTASAVQAATAWPVSITGSNDIILAAAEAAAGDMQVAITMLSATGVITPHAVSSGMATQLMNYVVTNTNVGSITGLNIIIPAGFTYVNLGILTITGGKSWSAAYSNGVITLTAQTGSDSLNTGENISVPITVATQAAGLASVIWPVIITGFVSGTFSASEAVSGDMKVNIVAYTLTVASDSAVILPSSTITVRGTLLDINAAPKSGAVINFSILSGDAVLTGSTAATTDISGKAYVRVSFGASGGKVTVRGVYGVNNSTDAVFEVLTAAPLLSANNLNFDKANITYAKATTKFKLQGISGLTLEYKIDGGSWQVYAGEFSLTSVGAHTVYYRYSDANGVKGPFGSAGIYVTPTDSKFVNYPNPFAAGKDSTVLEYNLPEDAQVKVEIFNLFGELVWSKEASSGQPGGKAGINNAFIWDGKNNIGEVVANGGYICRITAAGASSTNVQRRKIGVIK